MNAQRELFEEAIRVEQSAHNLTKDSLSQVGEELRQERHQLDDCPKVMLLLQGKVGQLVIQAMAFDAINVRLVEKASESYFIRSNVVRHARLGTPYDLKIHAVPLTPDPNDPYKHVDADKFFQDHYPKHGTDGVELLNDLLRDMYNSQIAVGLQIAYSDDTGNKHFRSSFRIRWQYLEPHIVEVEFISTNRDFDPPSVDQPNVLSITKLPAISRRSTD